MDVEGTPYKEATAAQLADRRVDEMYWRFYARFPNVALHAYTATATGRVRNDIAAQIKTIFEQTTGVVDTDWYVEQQVVLTTPGRVRSLRVRTTPGRLISFWTTSSRCALSRATTRVSRSPPPLPRALAAPIFQCSSSAVNS